ncbi:MAG: glycosyltransferase, partial [Rubrivivax sp.]
RATPAEVAAALARARALVVPSRVAEHSPRVGVEALAQGLPVVGSDLGSVPELLAASPDDASAVGGLGPSEAGWRVPPGDAEALAQALGVAHDEVHIDPTQALARQRLALAMHAARHAPAVHADALRAIYA